MAVRGVVLYELVCTECAEQTPAITSPDGCADLDEPLVCGHDPIRRAVVDRGRDTSTRG